MIFIYHINAKNFILILLFISKMFRFFVLYHIIYMFLKNVVFTSKIHVFYCTKFWQPKTFVKQKYPCITFNPYSLYN